MKFKINKKVAIVMAVLILSLALASSAFAADNYKNLKAWFGDIKIFNNNTPVQLKDQPFIVDGTTYLPVRSVAEMLGKDITWNGTTRQIGINDKPGTSYSEMQNKFIVQEVKNIELEGKVKDLETKVKDLEAKLKAKEESKVSTLSDLEKVLNKNHGTDNKISFDIKLYGNVDNIEVRIFVNKDRYNYGWDSFTSTQKERYLQDIVYDILKEFKNAKVSGYVEDGSTYGRLTSFTVSTRGIVSLDNRYNDDYYYGDLQKRINENFSYTSSNGIRDIQVTESNNRVFLSVNVDPVYWNTIRPTRAQELLLEDIADFITARYDYNKYYYVDISGTVKSNNVTSMFNFDFYSGGDVRIN